MEIEVLSQLQHPNIVKYLGTNRSKNSFNIFLEYVAGLINFINIY